MWTAAHHRQSKTFFCTKTSLNSIFEPNNPVCGLWAINERYEALWNIRVYVCMCLKVSVNYSQPVKVFVYSFKLDRVGPVNKRPSTDRLHHFVRKKINKINCDMWHVTPNTWHVTHDTWHVTCDMFGGVNILLKFQLPSSFCLWFMILWRSKEKALLLLLARLFIEQPRYTWSVK